jgi:CRISPR-associated protein Csy1
MTNPITDFLNDRKATWLKAKKLDTLDEPTQAALHQEANQRFALATWLPDAANRAGQLFMASHPSKFSHPSAKTSSVIADQSPRLDGYLRTGNVAYPLDVFGNAAAMDVHKFLSLTMPDGRTILAHLEANTDEIRAALTIDTTPFEDVQQGLLAIKTNEAQVTTDGLVKQVYFPITNQPQASHYHLLSILTPSGLLSVMKQRIDVMRFSEATKEAKEARRQLAPSATGYSDMIGLTVTAYGGTKPQNISALNSQNGGVAYLLPCLPPTLTQREIRLPKNDFFSESLRLKAFKDDVMALHRLMARDQNNLEIRNEIQQKLQEIIDKVLQTAFSIRQNYDAGWSETEHYQNLPQTQRIWLDNRYSPDRTTTDEWATGRGKRDKNTVFTRDDEDMWLDAVINDCARWILHAYEQVMAKNAKLLGDDELLAVRTMVDKTLSNDKELFV